MNLIWRFYFGPDHRWRWQRLSLEGNVVTESSTSYAAYDGCLASASEQGYVFAPVAAPIRRRSAPLPKRTYTRRKRMASH
jgi:hypothetical protein